MTTILNLKNKIKLSIETITKEFIDFIFTYTDSSGYTYYKNSNSILIEEIHSFIKECIKQIPENTFQDKDEDVLFTTYLSEIWDSRYIAEKIERLISSSYSMTSIYKGILHSNIRKTKENLTKYEFKNHPDLAKAYFTNTPLEQFFFMQLPFSIPFQKKFEHTHICAGSGHGKTQLLLSLIYQDIKKAVKGKGGLCVIDSQGDLLQTLLKLKEFDPTLKKSLSEKLIFVDPSNIDYSPQLNIFDVNLEQMRQNMSASDFSMMENSTIELFNYIFNDLGSGLGGAGYQQNIFENCSKLLLRVEGATIYTFMELLRKGEKFKKHFSKVDYMCRDFFENEFFSKEYDNTKKQIAVRLRLLLNNTNFEKMVNAKKNKINIFNAMNEGKIVFVNTAKDKLFEERCSMMGKIFIAMILQATFRRASIPEDKRKPFFIYIDEIQDYLTDKVANLLSQARKYKVGVIFAHQDLEQIAGVSKKLVSSVMSNTSIKIMGTMNISDSRKMAGEMMVKPEVFGNLKKVDYKYSEYICFIRGITNPAVKIKMPLGIVNNKPQMSDESYNLLIKQQREKFCRGMKDNKKQPFFTKEDEKQVSLCLEKDFIKAKNSNKEENKPDIIQVPDFPEL